MVSFSNERLHICQGVCEKCLEKIENHLGSNFSYGDFKCEKCEKFFLNEFCFESHKAKKLYGEFQSYCDYLSSLENCEPCIKNFELNLKCEHFGKEAKMFSKKKAIDDERTLIRRVYSSVNNIKREYVKCGFCSDFYLKGNSLHSYFLKSTDSIFANPSGRSSIIKSQNVFFYDIESRLENYFECKVESPEKIGSNGNLICQKR